MLVVSNCQATRALNTAYLANLRAKIENHPMSAAAAAKGDDDKLLDSNVAECFEAFLSAMWTSSERTLYREEVGRPFANYYLGDERPKPSGLIIARDTAVDQATYEGVSVSFTSSPTTPFNH